MGIKVVIIDDHPIMLNGLRYMLEASDKIDLMGAYHCEDALFHSMKEYPPDVILECCRHGRTGDSLVQRVYRSYPDTRILALVSTGLALCIRNILKEERAGYLLAKADLDILTEAIETVHQGERYIDPVFSDHFSVRKLPQNTSERLSKREKEILDLVIKGLTNQQIAEELFLSIRTVENHRGRMLQKMNVKNTAAMVKNAVETGLV